MTQAPFDGVSFAYTLADAAAEIPRRTQYFEMLGHRAIYHDGWRAVCPWPGPSFAEAGVGFGQPISAERLSELDANAWELYHIAEDFAENYNVAAENRNRLIALIATWYAEAGKYGVLPIDGSWLTRMVSEKPVVAAPRDSYRYYPNTQSIPFFAGPRVLNRPHSITAEVDILKPVPRACCSESEVTAGRHSLRFEFEPTGPADMAAGKGTPGRLQLYIDEVLVGNTEAPVTIPFAVNPGALTCGSNAGSSVIPDYLSPFPFTGSIDHVTIDVSGELIQDPEAELQMHLARQ